ncbi:hypothetical protein ACFX13_021128 [Malus domestica]|uniref:Uncharacterized protein n=1 Tax=Malus domestica TaxID=3750 RepID=A0A498HL28_MALDO|nr:hypothetical protein DVH24_007353 [Malus domestica]
MASTSSLKSINFSSCKNTVFVVLLVLNLLMGCCTATRLGKTLVVSLDGKALMNLDHTETFNPRKHKTGFRYKGQIFSYFPKGTIIPPSGPSKRHNSVVDSTPRN